MQKLTQRVDGRFRRRSGRKSAVKAHGVEALFHILKFLLADNDISADSRSFVEKTRSGESRF